MGSINFNTRKEETVDSVSKRCTSPKYKKFPSCVCFPFVFNVFEKDRKAPLSQLPLLQGGSLAVNWALFRSSVRKQLEINENQWALSVWKKNQHADCLYPTKISDEARLAADPGFRAGEHAVRSDVAATRPGDDGRPGGLIFHDTGRVAALGRLGFEPGRFARNVRAATGEARRAVGGLALRLLIVSLSFTCRGCCSFGKWVLHTGHIFWFSFTATVQTVHRELEKLAQQLDNLLATFPAFPGAILVGEPFYVNFSQEVRAEG